MIPILVFPLTDCCLSENRFFIDLIQPLMNIPFSPIIVFTKFDNLVNDIKINFKDNEESKE
jgi:hypothetical protein